MCDWDFLSASLYFLAWIRENVTIKKILSLIQKLRKEKNEAAYFFEFERAFEVLDKI